MSVTHIDTLSQLNGILKQSKDKLTVIDFHATWCGPCIAIAPKYDAWAKKHANVNFLKCDVDKAADVASEYRVTAMPTFVFIKNGTKVDQVKGADAGAIEKAISKHASGSSSVAPGVFKGKGQTLGGGPVPTDYTGDAKRAVDSVKDVASAGFANIDPQIKVLGGLVGLYLLFWYLG